MSINSAWWGTVLLLDRNRCVASHWKGSHYTFYENIFVSNQYDNIDLFVFLIVRGTLLDTRSTSKRLLLPAAYIYKLSVKYITMMKISAQCKYVRSYWLYIRFLFTWRLSGVLACIQKDLFVVVCSQTQNKMTTIMYLTIIKQRVYSSSYLE